LLAALQKARKKANPPKRDFSLSQRFPHLCSGAAAGAGLWSPETAALPAASSAGAALLGGDHRLTPSPANGQQTGSAGVFPAAGACTLLAAKTPVEVVDPNDDYCCVSRNRDLALLQCLSDPLLKRPRAGGCLGHADRLGN